MYFRYDPECKTYCGADTFKEGIDRGLKLVLRIKIYGEGKLGRYFLGIGLENGFDDGR